MLQGYDSIISIPIIAPKILVEIECAKVSLKICGIGEDSGFVEKQAPHVNYTIKCNSHHLFRHVYSILIVFT